MTPVCQGMAYVHIRCGLAGAQPIRARPVESADEVVKLIDNGDEREVIGMKQEMRPGGAVMSMSK